jgi:uncharacterized SAM-binding protein YcdF (DUF218 family)
MTIESAIKIVWDYMHMSHKLEKADAIMALGSYDIRVAEYAAKLWIDGWAPYLICAGSGTVHSESVVWQGFVGSTEAEIFADIARKAGVPDDVILIENKSQNTGQNYEFTMGLLKEKGLELKRLIAVQKPFMERRTYATGKVWLPEQVELIVTSPDLSLEEYPNEIISQNDHWIHNMIGDLQRVKEYPERGFQIHQDIPEEVWDAYQFLVGEGYSDNLLKD